MSKLTNHQIKAQISRLQDTIRSQSGDLQALKRRKRTLAAYQAELAEREAAGLNPGTEIQTARHGENA